MINVQMPNGLRPERIETLVVDFFSSQLVASPLNLKQGVNAEIKKQDRNPLSLVLLLDKHIYGCNFKKKKKM